MTAQKEKRGSVPASLAHHPDGGTVDLLPLGSAEEAVVLHLGEVGEGNALVPTPLLPLLGHDCGILVVLILFSKLT